MSPLVFFARVLPMLMILAGLVPSGSPTPASSTLPQCRFDPDGYFYLKGNAQPASAEIDFIQLQASDKSDPRQPLESRLHAKNGKSYRLAKLGEFQTHSSGAGITFEFTTEIIDGVSYQFSGKFTSICVLADTVHDLQKVVAVGRLLKFERGQQKKAADVELTYSKSPRQPQSKDGSDPEAGAGREVLAIVSKIELKAYTDHLADGAVLVSDVIRFEVVEPKELTHVTVIAYYRGAPDVQGKRLQVGDLVRFELPNGPQRHGILLRDLKGLRLRE